MMRVVGRISTVAVALSLVAATAAMATPARVDLSDSMNFIPGGDTGAGPRTFTGTGFEPSDGFGLGSISAVNGWRCFGAANATPPGPRCSPPGVVANFKDPPRPANGSQFYELTNNLNHPQPTNIGGFTPKFKDFTLDTLNFDFKMDDNGGAHYEVVPQTPLGAQVNTRFYFDYGGYMYVLHDVNNDNTTGAYIKIGTWNANQWDTYQLVFNHAAGTFTAWRGPDKGNLTQLCDIETGLGCVFNEFGGTTGFIEEVVLLSDNFQNTGLGSFSGHPQSGDGAAYVDNIVLKPEPGTLAMLGAGLVLALRRRRAR